MATPSSTEISAVDIAVSDASAGKAGDGNFKNFDEPKKVVLDLVKIKK